MVGEECIEALRSDFRGCEEVLEWIDGDRVIQYESLLISLRETIT